MIKVGVSISPFVSPRLLRLLKNHPDVEIVWVDSFTDFNGRFAEYFDELHGEFGEIPVNKSSSAADLSDIDLYIGAAGDPSLPASFGENTKAIISGCFENEDAILGVCEFNRKAIVRGGRIVVMPDDITMLGALALMPLAKNLMLNSPVTAIAMLNAPRRYSDFYVNPVCISNEITAPLRNDILMELQKSFNSPVDINIVENRLSSFSFGKFDVNIKLSARDAYEMFNGFYSDHRHIVLSDRGISDAMVLDTNKTVISFGNDSSGLLSVYVGFDSRYKAGAGNILHAMNLLFGLDERAGFGGGFS